MTKASEADGQSEQEQAQRYAGAADLTPVVEVLQAKRDEILSRWLRAVEQQPCHLGRPARAVADNIPPLFDTIVANLAKDASIRGSSSSEDSEEPARLHAQARAAQGLLPAEVVTEFRLLRQEILHTLRKQIPEDENPSDLLGAELLLSDALDAAIGTAINYFVDALEEAKDDFVAIAAHDLRTPLTVLKGTAQFLNRQAAAGSLSETDLRDNLQLIAAQAGRVDDLITKLLDITRVSAGRFDLASAPTDLEQVVHQVIERLGPEAQQRTVVQAPNRPLIGNWDTGRIEQLVENLMTNALKYAPTGPIHVTLDLEGNQANLQVRDEGIGLSTGDQAQLFRRFYRTREAIEQKITGTGLGLYIAHGIVAAHGGEIRATSPGPGCGSTFTVTLPVPGLQSAEKTAVDLSHGREISS